MSRTLHTSEANVPSLFKKKFVEMAMASSFNDDEHADWEERENVIIVKRVWRRI